MSDTLPPAQPEAIDEPNLSVSERFTETIEHRTGQLKFLCEQLDSALDLLENLDDVNKILSASSRPDLAIDERVEMMPIESPYLTSQTNNFTSRIEGIGMKLFAEIENILTGELETQYAGRRKLTDSEMETYFLSGARGGYSDFLKFAEENNIDEDLARDIVMSTHIKREAFIRMWILFPELTEHIIAYSFDDFSETRKSTAEESHVAYLVMARLVDVGDLDIVNEDGEINHWGLCS